uniref:Uncharacterized protein n=1 Tax=Anopheles dirus TaxID=7168 RepID=A0A182N306_9DIPT
MVPAYYVVPKNGEPANRILQRVLDLCAYVKRPKSDRLFKIIYDHMKIDNQFPSGCPLKEKEEYYIRHLRPAAIRIPGFLPESGFIYETNYYTGVSSVPVLSTRFHGELVRVMNHQLSDQ